MVFVGFDEENIPRFACLRGTYTDKQFRMDCVGSDNKYGFHLSFSSANQLYIFESQIEFCQYELKGGSFKEYIDKGYSGKNVDRPQFQQLMEDIKQGLIAKGGCV